MLSDNKVSQNEFLGLYIKSNYQNCCPNQFSKYLNPCTEAVLNAFLPPSISLKSMSDFLDPLMSYLNCVHLIGSEQHKTLGGGGAQHPCSVISAYVRVTIVPTYDKILLLEW